MRRHLRQADPPLAAHARATSRVTAISMSRTKCIHLKLALSVGVETVTLHPTLQSSYHTSAVYLDRDHAPMVLAGRLIPRALPTSPVNDIRHSQVSASRIIAPQSIGIHTYREGDAPRHGPRRPLLPLQAHESTL